ncbi:MAG: hypothetical protein A2W95_08150 [Bacteroidetes bacterium GWA2_40_14]|nr:MAG: hypothetical protein A2W95_08150 [Bacteroidetes bacterium GWA2_40_14]OFX63112.1 MAG: hypothetical protein A2W84_03455 [Bacteroidetes bacterium GWC2_40_13]
MKIDAAKKQIMITNKAMNEKTIRRRMQALLIEPQNEFRVIQSENLSSGAILNQYMYPVLLIFMVTTFIGSIVFGAATFLEGILIFVFSILITIPSLLLSIYLGIWLLKKWMPKILIDYKQIHLHLSDIKTPNLGSKTFTLISYSLTPVYLSMIVSGVFPRLSDLINLFGLYGLVLYWQGAEVLFGYPLRTRRLFVTVSIFLFVSIFVIFRYGMKTLFEFLIF